MEPITTTLKDIRSHSPCASGWTKLLAALGKIKADDEPLALVTILESNDLDDALWCLRAIKGHEREMRLFAVACARRVQHLMTDPGSLVALDVAERFANGQATEAQRAAAWAAADAAARAAAGAAARDTARDTAWDAAGAAARDTAWDAAGAAAWDTARDTAWDAARAAAWDAAGAAERDAAWDAAWAAAWAAARAAEREWQAQKFIEIFGGNDG